MKTFSAILAIASLLSLTACPQSKDRGATSTPSPDLQKRMGDQRSAIDKASAEIAKETASPAPSTSP